MSLINNVLSFFKRKTSLTGFFWGTEVYADINAANVISEGFNKNTAVYSIVMKDAEKFASIPRYLMGEDDKIIEDNELTKLLNRPNPGEGQDAFLTKVRAFYKVTGEAFIWLNRGMDEGVMEDEAWAKLPVLEMYVFPSDKVTLIPDPSDMWGVLGYRLDDGSTRKPLRKVDIIHWKNTTLDFDSTNRTHLRGKPPLSPGANTLQQNKDASKAAVRMYQNDGSKGFVYNETMNNLNPKQKSDAQGVVDGKFNNPDTKSSIAMLPGKWGYASIESGVDMKLLEGIELTWKEMCFLLSVPYELFDSETTFANKTEAQKGWVSNSIMPSCKQLDDELNRMLLPAFKITGAKIKSDCSELPEMQTDMEKLTNTLSKIPLTLDEMREAAGYEKIGGEEMEQVYLNNQPINQDDGFDEMAKEVQRRMNDGSGNKK